MNTKKLFGGSLLIIINLIAIVSAQSQQYSCPMGGMMYGAYGGIWLWNDDSYLADLAACCSFDNCSYLLACEIS